MRATRRSIWSLAILLLALPVGAQEETPEMTPEQMAMMEAWQKAMTPGEPHERLAASAGSWKLTIKMWMDPSTEPLTSEGTAERQMILGGRVLEEKVESQMMGDPFKGLGHTGYDNVTGKYWATWLDTMSTGCYVSHGVWDETAGGVVMHGEYKDPLSGNTIKIRSVMRPEGADKQIFEWYEDRGTGEMKTMEITYQRSA